MQDSDKLTSSESSESYDKLNIAYLWVLTFFSFFSQRLQGGHAVMARQEGENGDLNARHRKMERVATTDHPGPRTQSQKFSTI
jgi:hypothetical protein